MTQTDKDLVIQYMGGISPKGLLEGTEITASREEIQEYIDSLHLHLVEMFGGF